MRKHGSQAILAVKPHQRMRLRKLMSREVARESRERFSQFLSIPPVPFVSETPEPVIAVGLADGRAGTHHLPALAAGVASSTHPIQPAESRGEVVAFRQGALAGS